MTLLFLLSAVGVLIKCVYARRTSDNELKTLRYELFLRPLLPYISFFEHAPPASRASWRSALWAYAGWGDNGRASNAAAAAADGRMPRVLPHVDMKTRESHVSYSLLQTGIFMRYTIGKLNSEDYVRLGIVNNLTEARALQGFDQASPERFRHFGRMIGNVCTFRGGKGQEPLRYDSEKAQYALRDDVRFDEVAPKFVKIGGQLKEHPTRRVVVYSNFNRASATLSAYLRGEGIRHYYLPDPQQRAQPTPDATKRIHWWRNNVHGRADEGRDGRLVAPIPGVLILGASYSEGLSVKRADVLHVLDPCIELAKAEQVRARVVRLDSHRPGERVAIYEWWCDLGRFRSATVSLSTWCREMNLVFYTDMLRHHKQCITPDAIVQREVNRLEGIVQRLNAKLRTRTFDAMAKLDAVPRYPAEWKCQTTDVGECKMIRRLHTMKTTTAASTSLRTKGGGRARRRKRREGSRRRKTTHGRHRRRHLRRRTLRGRGAVHQPARR